MPISEISERDLNNPSLTVDFAGIVV